MGLHGVPEAAVYGNASEIPDSESGMEGNPAALQYPNETLPVEEVTIRAEAEGLDDEPADPA